MSSFKKVDGMIDSIQKQAVGAKTLDGSAIEDFLSIAGYEDPAGDGGGGGGDSDFKSVKMTLVNESAGEFTITGPFGLEAGQMGEGSPIMSYPEVIMSSNYNETVAVAIYKDGSALVGFFSGTPVTVVATTGDIVYDSENGFARVTGDCTLTITNESP